MDNLNHFPILVIDDQLQADNSSGAAVRRIIYLLKQNGFSVLEALSADDGLDIMRSNSSISCVLLEWELGRNRTSKDSVKVVKEIRKFNHQVSIFIMTQRYKLADVDLSILPYVNDYIWKVEDTPHFIAGRIAHEVEDYLDNILPPFFKALLKYADNYKYAWHTPGHMGGVAFLKAATGQLFYDFYGENVFRSDLSVSVPELGSLMDHSGVVADAEAHAAKIFNAEQTYFVTNGTSTANKMVMHSCVTDGDLVLIDRNCHKSLQHALTMTGAIPIYLIPERNAYGIIGGITHEEFSTRKIQQKINSNPLVKNKKLKPKLAVITNSTYDGLVYDVVYIKNKLKNIVEHLHFDEAWFSYANFHQLYQNRYAMCEQHKPEHPAIYATQSAHKMLAAFSQASMLHIKSGSKEINHQLFNEAYMMHTSTSPQYSIIASLDVAAKMMEGESGHALVEKSLGEAITFRKKIVQIKQQLRNDWFFDVWQPPGIDKMSKQALRSDAKTWCLNSKSRWHGYKKVTDNYLMLDPIKVSILMPGINASGTMQEHGIPAPILASFLMNKGIVDEKTGFYVFLLLFSIGSTHGKSGTLLAALVTFKNMYDANIPLATMLPQLAADYPHHYAEISIKEFSAKMHQFLKIKNITALRQKMLADLPEPVVTPAAAYRKLVQGKVKLLKLAQLAGRTTAVMLVPYPPGIPIMMPGERFAARNCSIIEYLSMLEEFDNLFPGFERDVHGVVKTHNKGKIEYQVYCL